MPNHFHGLLSIINSVGDEFKSSQSERTDSISTKRADLKPAPTKQYGLSEIIRGFKTFTTRKINKIHNTPGQKLWQRSFFDHIIRNDQDYWNSQSYIDINPAKWDWDTESLKSERTIQN